MKLVIKHIENKTFMVKNNEILRYIIIKIFLASFYYECCIRSLENINISLIVFNKRHKRKQLLSLWLS